MKSMESFLLDDYVSPKILAGPHASDASRAAAAALRDDPHYQELARRLKDTGFFDRAVRGFAWRIPVFALAYLGGFGYLLVAHGLVGQAIACCVIAFAHVHGNFIAHDAGHGAITRNPRATEVIGQLFDTFLGGYSFSYFRRVHDLHHYHCNEIDRDPNTMAALFALHPAGFADQTALARATTRRQHILIPLLYPLWGFALRAEGVTYVLRNWRTRWVDAVLLVGHLALWFTFPVHYLGWPGAAISYVAVTMLASIYLATIIPINHIGMPTLDQAAAAEHSFITQQVITSRNLTSSPVRDFLFIGQNAQIEHHLFPWAPTMNLGRGRRTVRAFCRERGIRYHECTYLAALREVQHHLANVARHTPADRPIEHAALEAADDALSQPG